MLFHSTPIEGCKIVELEKRGDERGYFARYFCKDEFVENGLITDFPQINTSLSASAGTLRGLHYQTAPHGEAKYVRCVSGSIFDVAVDLRRSSETYMKWFGTTLSTDNKRMLYVPRGCAHGFLTLADNTELIYMSSSPYQATAERVLRWNDPAFGINWPIEPTVLSEKDANATNFDSDLHESGY